MASDSLALKHDIRRQARGTEPLVEQGRWKLRLKITGALLLIGALAATAYITYLMVTFVPTVRAQVRSSTVVLAPSFDAPLAAINVHHGDFVEKGQVLGRYDDTERRAALAAAEAGVRLKQSRHQAAQTELSAAQSSLELAKVRLKEEIIRAEANRNSAAASLQRLQNGAREEEIGAAEARLASAKALADLYNLQLQQSQRLFDRGIESSLDLEIRKTQLTTQNNVVTEAELMLAKLKKGTRPELVEEARQVVAARQAELALAKAGTKNIDRLMLETASKEAQLIQAKAELEQAEADAAIKKAALAKMEIISPVSGTIVRIYFNASEVVRKGEIVFKVADDSRGRWVEGYIAERDAGLIEIGQSAEIEIGVDSGDYVSGTVSHMAYGSVNASPGRDQGFSETGNYGRPAPLWVRLKLDDTDLQLRPGTSAKALIRIR